MTECGLFGSPALGDWAVPVTTTGTFTSAPAFWLAVKVTATLEVRLLPLGAGGANCETTVDGRPLMLKPIGPEDPPKRFNTTVTEFEWPGLTPAPSAKNESPKSAVETAGTSKLRSSMTTQLLELTCAWITWRYAISP